MNPTGPSRRSPGRGSRCRDRSGSPQRIPSTPGPTPLAAPVRARAFDAGVHPEDQAIDARAPNGWSCSTEHHDPYIPSDRAAPSAMLTDNTNMRGASRRPAVRRGESLLAGLLRCRRCRRRLHVTAVGQHGSFTRYHCLGAHIDHRTAAPASASSASGSTKPLRARCCASLPPGPWSGAGRRQATASHRRGPTRAGAGTAAGAVRSRPGAATV